MATVYETKQAIREEAGLQNEVLGEQTQGVADGSNKIFTVSRKPLVDRNYDDVVDKNDVVCYVNNVPVTVDSVDSVSGAITLHSAPALSAIVKADYATSNVKDGFLSQLILETQETIDTLMGKIVTVPYTSVPATIRKVMRLMTASFLLIRDYGFNTDTEATSKDGFKKLSTSNTLLSDYYDSIAEKNVQGGFGASQSNDGSLFSANDGNGNIRPDNLENFIFPTDQL